jgi:hypothetical protein
LNDSELYQSYALITFPDGFASQGGLYKDARIAIWSWVTLKYFWKLFDELKKFDKVRTYEIKDNTASHI